MDYELTTIEDIYKKVPPDRWNVCLDELKELFRIRAEKEFSKDIITHQEPRPLIWRDDGKGEIRTTLRMGDVVIEDEVHRIAGG